ncbi:MAG TPA: hypothetical protein VK986_17590 [Tepidisphaeraceae bacterium]|nr:hypothetical protein [Tepidisphaeraceae bacterium]
MTMTGVRTWVVIGCTVVPLIAAAADPPAKYRPWPKPRSDGANAMRLLWPILDERRSVEERVLACLDLLDTRGPLLREREWNKPYRPALDELERVARSPGAAPPAVRSAVRLLLWEVAPDRTTRRPILPAHPDPRERARSAESAVDELVRRSALGPDIVQEKFRLAESERAAAVSAALRLRSIEADRPRAEWVIWCLVGADETEVWKQILAGQPRGDGVPDRHAIEAYWGRTLKSGGPDADRLLRVARTCEGSMRDGAYAAMLALGKSEVGSERASAEVALAHLRSAAARPGEAADVALMRWSLKAKAVTPEVMGACVRWAGRRQAGGEQTEVQSVAGEAWRAMRGSGEDRYTPEAAATWAVHALWEDHVRDAWAADDLAARRSRDLAAETPADGPARQAVIRQYVLAAALGDEWAERRIVASKVDDIPEARAVMAVAQDKSPLALRAWFVRMTLGQKNAVAALAGLMSDGDPGVRLSAAMAAGVDPLKSQAVVAVQTLLEEGKPIGVGPLRALNVRSDGLAKLAGERLLGPDASKDGKSSKDAKRAALEVLAVLGTSDAAVRAELERRYLRGPGAEERALAAEALGTDEARRTARLPSLLAELRGPSPEGRARAARELQSLGFASPAVSAALIKAVDAGDFAAREGLAIALQTAWERDVQAEQVLAAADAEKDETKRAYLRAARRAVGKAPPPP